MMNKLLFLCVLFSFSGCASNDPWTRQDTLGQVVVTIAIVGDGVSSLKIHETDGIYEAGPVAYRVMGRQPTEKDLIMYNSTLAVSSWLIARWLPAKWRRWWQTIETGVHGYAWYNNCDLGLC